MSYNDVSLGDDIIDSRSVIERVNEIESEIDDLRETIEEIEASDDPAGALPLHDELEGLREELEPLKALAEAGEDATSEWADGAQLILDSYFETFAQDFAEDIGAIEHSDRWPNYCIDWERAAAELRMDYTCIEVRGYTYWVR